MLADQVKEQQFPHETIITVQAMLSYLDRQTIVLLKLYQMFSRFVLFINKSYL
jgi:hypothetical protein